MNTATSASLSPLSGWQQLDEAIVAFVAAHPELEEMRVPQHAWGNCEIVAEQCAEFLKARGFKAYATTDELCMFDGYQQWQDSRAIGAGDFTYPEHAMVEVYNVPERGVLTITIDFTAAQYGFSEFPKVHGGPGVS